MISAVFNKAPQHIVRSCAGRGGGLQEAANEWKAIFEYTFCLIPPL